MIKQLIRYFQTIFDEVFVDNGQSCLIQMLPELTSIIALFILFSWNFVTHSLFPGISAWSKFVYLFVFFLGILNGLMIIWYRRAMVFIHGIPAIIIGVLLFISSGVVVLYIIQQLSRP